MKNIVKMALAASALVAFAGVAHAEGDAAKGKDVFKKCMACHKVEAGKNSVGPSLFGVVGRKAATAEGFKYSTLLSGAGELGLVWDEEHLEKYLAKGGVNTSSEEFIKSKGGTPTGKSKMAFAGLDKDDDRANVIAYLSSLK